MLLVCITVLTMLWDGERIRPVLLTIATIFVWLATHIAIDKDGMIIQWVVWDRCRSEEQVSKGG